MTDLAKLVVKLEAESSRLQKGLDQANSRLKGFERRADSFASNVKKTLGGAFVISGAVAGARMLAAAMTSQIRAAEEAERSLAKLDALILTTGQSAGLTARDLDEFSRTLARSTLASTTGVRDAAGQLLTFRSVTGETFKETLRLAQDLAATGFGTLESATVQLGKALEDPAQGLSALTRSGVSFAQSEKELIRTLQDSGRQLDAQNIILDKVRQQVGGAGAAEAGGLSGAVDTLAQNWDEWLEAVGRSGQLQFATRAVNTLAGALESLNRKIFTPDQDRFYELADRRVDLVKKLESAQGRTGQSRRQTAGIRAEIAEVEAEMRALQDRNIERAKKRRAAELAAEAQHQQRMAEAAEATQKEATQKRLADTSKMQEAEARKFTDALASLLDELDPVSAETQKYLERVALLDRALAEMVIGEERHQELLMLLATDTDALREAEEALAKDRERAVELIKGLDPGSSIRDQILEVQRLRDTIPGLADALGYVELELQTKWDKIGEDARDAAEKTKTAWQELGPTFSSAFEDAIISGRKFSDALNGLEQDMLRIFTRKLVTEPLGNAIGGLFSSGGEGSFLSGIFGNLFGGARAMGGPVSTGRAYLVGEQGPELFMPRGSGQIMPAGGTAMAMGGNTYNFSFSLPSDSVDHRRTAQQVAREAARYMQIAQGAV